MKTTSSTQRHLTSQEFEVELGERLKKLRVHQNLDQATLAARAGISVRTLRNLESGSGSSLHTLIQVVRALGREQWFETIAPVPTINPLMLTRTAVPRQRASKPRLKSA
ncbi:helix-turn-helix domain-containing protein [Crenobacter oryzisoli]|uniref:helix-turn-helix domain-containing protein n=1 Tax=Crenobacter oryzisoli TaxID=3056844 RepID=UPI00338F7908